MRRPAVQEDRTTTKTNHDRSGPPTTTSELADAAAGSDLDRIEDAWIRAQDAARGADTDDIDADFAAACATLCAAISDGLAERARTARDELATQARFVAAKHPRWSDPFGDTERD